MKTARPLFAACLALFLTAGSFARQPSTPASTNADSIGSLRNARVAFPIPQGAAPADRPKLTFFAGSMTDIEQATIEKLAPNVTLVTGLSRDAATARAAEADGIDARIMSPAFLEKATKLVWVHSPSAGVDRFIAMDGIAKNDKIVLTNSRAAHGPAIADHAMAMLLTLTRNLRYYEAEQGKSRWTRGATPAPSFALQDRTMLVVGIGGIGTEIAQRAHGFGMKVIATRRTDTPAPDYVARVGKPADLLSMLPEADVVAVCVPLTPETEHMFNAEAFAAMKPGSYLINIARGKVIDTDAMLAALKSGQLAGACLDVTEPEPLPADHPLWKQPNVIITPHVASDATLTDERIEALVIENIRRFGAGEPLLNVVDKQAGY